jgi:PKD repeat protein
MYKNKYMSKGIVKAFFLLCTPCFFSPVFAQSEDCDAHPDDEMMHDEHCAVFALVPEDGASHISITSGNWFSPGTWNTGTVPGADAEVLIDSGTTVTYNGYSNAEIFTLRINGNLTFATAMNTRLVVHTIVVDPHGYLNMGTEASPVLSSYVAEVIFPDQGPIDTEWDPYQFGKGLVSHGYTTVHGAAKEAILPLNAAANAGNTLIQVASTPTGWQVGDRLILAGTQTDHSGSLEDNSRFQDEVLTITSISGNNIYFINEATGSNALLYSHVPPAGYGLKVYVGNLTRNVRFTSENADIIPIKERGHIMLMHNPAQSMSYCSIVGLGRSDKGELVDDPVVDEMGMVMSGGNNPRGRYPLHAHQAGRHDYSGVPLSITGCVVEDAPAWGFVNHSSHVVMSDNIVFEFKGAGFVTEAGDELGSFIHNLAVKGIGLNETDYLIPLDRLILFDMGLDGDAYWMKGSNVSHVDNIAASCNGLGFSYFSDDDDFTADRRVKMPKATLLNPGITGAADSIYSAVTPVRENSGSVAYNVYGALSFWTHMYNNDNIGDFSRNEYIELTHNAESVIDNFRFWNCTSQGISLSYSSQIALKDGILLGDLEYLYLNPADGTLSSENAGYGINSNGVSGQIRIEGCTIAGWQKACVALRTDNLVSGDGLEYNYNLSSLENNTFHTNVINMFPETGQDEYYYPEYEQFPEHLIITDDNNFTPYEANLDPVANFSYEKSGGNGIRFYGGLSSDSDPIVSNQGNGIAAYRWDFGDGHTGYGIHPIHVYAEPGTYTVTLLVYDSKGQTGSHERTVVVNTIPYANQLLQSGMEMDLLTDRDFVSNINVCADAGWGRSNDWQLENGKAVIYKSLVNRYLSQVVQNDYALQGVIPFSVQAKNLGSGAIGNSLRVELIGINGEFLDQDPAVINNIDSWNNNDPAFEKTVLLNEEIGMAEYNWQTFMQDVDLGEGYQYLVMKVYSNGVQMSKSDVQGVDNFCLPCICGIPAGMLEDNLTSSTATLIWDNVGAISYEVRVRPKGGSWTIYPVDNTFKDLTGLIPNKNYQWQVRVLCDGVWTAWSGLNSFLTPVAGSLCTSPVELSTSFITENTARLIWNAVPGAIQYKVSYRKTSGGAWTNLTLSDTARTISGLLPSTAYTWKVSAECSEGWKPFINMAYFSTLAARMGDADNNNPLYTGIQAYPNPVSDYLLLEIPEANGDMFVVITNLTGNQVLEEKIPGNASATTWQIDVQQLSTGIYVVQLYDGSGVLFTHKMVHQ